MGSRISGALRRLTDFESGIVIELSDNATLFDSAEYDCPIKIDDVRSVHANESRSTEAR